MNAETHISQAIGLLKELRYDKNKITDEEHYPILEHLLHAQKKVNDISPKTTVEQVLKIYMNEEQFSKIIKRLDEIKKQGNGNTTLVTESKWLTNEEFMRLMKVSRRTAQHYRDEGMISYSQVGNKLYYKLAEVEQMILRGQNKKRKGNGVAGKSI